MRLAISDIHCHARTFAALLERVNIGPGDELFILGDLVNRGPNLKELLKLLIHLEHWGIEIHYLLGNHEELLMDGLNKPNRRKLWLSRGGKDSLSAFSDLEELKTSIQPLKKKFKHFIELDDYVLVHAGLSKRSFNGKRLKRHREMYWIRNWRRKFDFSLIQGKTVIHGHTPQMVKQIKSGLKRIEKSKALSIDSGCYLKGREGYGSLCAFNLDSRELTFQKNID
jgi:serine/threonine protein phosphatase 1